MTLAALALRSSRRGRRAAPALGRRDAHRGRGPRRAPSASPTRCARPGSSRARRSRSSCRTGPTRSPRCSGSGWRARCSCRSTRARPSAERRHVLDGDAPGGAARRAAAPELLADPAPYDADVAFVTWTSGTTGHAQAGAAHARELPRAARPGARAAARRRRRRARRPRRPDTEPRAGVARAERRHLQRACSDCARAPRSS